MTASRSHLEDLGPLFAQPAPPRRYGPSRYRTTEPYNGQAPVAPGSDSSAKAGRRIEATRLTKREIVHTFLVAAGPYRLGAGGATRAEIRDGTGLIENTVNARVAELINLGRAKEVRERDGQKAHRGDRAVVVADCYVPEWQRCPDDTDANGDCARCARDPHAHAAERR